MRLFLGCIVLVCFVAGGVIPHTGSTSAGNFRSLNDSAMRGTNYCAAEGHHIEHWLNYDSKETGRELLADLLHQSEPCQRAPQKTTKLNWPNQPGSP